MSQEWAAKSVAVGIDGSQAAVDAAKWAVAEAASRGLPLRLIHVIPIAEPPPASTGDVQSEQESAETALCRAEYDVHAQRRSVDVETVLLRGDPGCVLIEESRDAAMICLGSEPSRSKPLGTTAATLAQRAHCPVAIIRTDTDAPHTDGGVIAVMLDDEPDNDAVVHAAMQEGRLRGATVRQIDRRMGSWVRRYPDVHVQIVAEGATNAEHRANHDAAIQLAVMGAEADELTQLVAPTVHPIFGYPDWSVLVVRS